MNRKRSRTGSFGPPGSPPRSSSLGTSPRQSTSSRLASGSRNAVPFGGNTSSRSSQHMAEGLAPSRTPSAMQKSVIGQGTTASGTQQAGLRTQTSRSDSLISDLARISKNRSMTSTPRGVSGTGLIAPDPIHITPVSAGIKSLFDDDPLHGPRSWRRTASAGTAALLQQLENDSATASRSGHRPAGSRTRQVQSQSQVHDQEEHGVLYDHIQTDNQNASFKEDGATEKTAKANSSLGSFEARQERLDSSSSMRKAMHSTTLSEKSRGKAALSFDGASTGLRSATDKEIISPFGKAEHKPSDQVAAQAAVGCLSAKDDGLKEQQGGLQDAHSVSSGEKLTETPSPFKTEFGGLNVVTSGGITSSAITTKQTFGNQAEGQIQYSAQGSRKVSQESERLGSSLSMEKSLHAATLSEESRGKTALSFDGASTGLTSATDKEIISPFGKAEPKPSDQAADQAAVGSLSAIDDGLKEEGSLPVVHSESSGGELTETAAPVKTESGSPNATTTEKIISSASTTKYTFGNEAECRIREKKISTTATDDALQTQQQDAVASIPENIEGLVRVGRTETERAKLITTGNEQKVGTPTHGPSSPRTAELHSATATDANIANKCQMPTFPSHDLFGARKTTLPVCTAGENNNLSVPGEDERMKGSGTEMVIQGSLIKDQVQVVSTSSHEVASGGLVPLQVRTLTDEKVISLTKGSTVEKEAISEPLTSESEREPISYSEAARDKVVAPGAEIHKKDVSAHRDALQRKVVAKPEAPKATDTSNYSYSSGAQVTMTQKSTSRWKNNTPVEQSHFGKIEGSNYQKTFDSSLPRNEQTPGGGMSEYQAFQITSSSGPTQAPSEEDTEIVKGRLDLSTERGRECTSEKEAEKMERSESATVVALTPLPDLPAIESSPKVSSEELHSTDGAQPSPKINKHDTSQPPVVESPKGAQTYLGAAAALFEPCFGGPQAESSSVNTEVSTGKEVTEEVKQVEKKHGGALVAPSRERPSYVEGPFTSTMQKDAAPLTPADVGSQPVALEHDKPISDDRYWHVHADSSLIDYAADDGVLERVVREVEKKILASADSDVAPLPDGTFPVRSSRGIESLGRLKYETHQEEGLLMRRSEDDLLKEPRPQAPTVSKRQPTVLDEKAVSSDEGGYAGALEEFYAEAQEKDRERKEQQSISQREEAIAAVNEEPVTRREMPLCYEDREYKEALTAVNEEPVTRREVPLSTEDTRAPEKGSTFEIEHTRRKDTDEVPQVQEKEQETPERRLHVEDSTYAGHDENREEPAKVGIQQDKHVVPQIKDKESGTATPVESFDALHRNKKQKAVEKRSPTHVPLGAEAQDEAMREAQRDAFATTPGKKKSDESKVYIKKHETDAVAENTVRRFIAAAIEEAETRKESQTGKKFRVYPCEDEEARRRVGSDSESSSGSKESPVLKSQKEKGSAMPQAVRSKSIAELIEEMINQNVSGNDARTCLDLARNKFDATHGKPRPLGAEHRQPGQVAVYYQTASTTPRLAGEGVEDFRGSPLTRKSYTQLSQLESTSQMEHPLSYSSTSGRGARCTIRKIEPGVLTYLVEVAPPEKTRETHSDMVMAEEQLLVSEIFEHLSAPSPRTSSSALGLNEARQASTAKSSESLTGIRNVYAEAVARRVLGRLSPTTTDGVLDQGQKVKFLKATPAERARKTTSSLSVDSSASVEDYILQSMLASELPRNRAEKLSTLWLKQEHASPRQVDSADALSNAAATKLVVPPPSPADHEELKRAVQTNTQSEKEMVDVSKPASVPRGSGRQPVEVEVAPTYAAGETKGRDSSPGSRSARPTETSELEAEQGGVQPTEDQTVKDNSSKTCGLCDNQIRAEESFESFICLGMHDLSPNLVPIPPEVSDVIKLRIATDNDVREVASSPWKEPQPAYALAAELATRHSVCPNGFYVAVDTAQGGRICGAASIMFYDEEVASCGFCLVHKDYSFRDVGALLWNQMLHATSGKNLFTLLPSPESQELISLYNLPSSTATGILSGPILVSRAALERKVLVLDYKDKYFEAVASYDKHVFGFSRRRFLAASMHEVGLYICVATRNERNVCGYGGIQRDDAGRLVLRWLFADDSETAESLLSCLLASCSHEDEISVVAAFFLRSVATRPILDKVNSRELKPWSMVYTKREPVHSYGRIVCLTTV